MILEMLWIQKGPSGIRGRWGDNNEFENHLMERVKRKAPEGIHLGGEGPPKLEAWDDRR
jgi:hypothetical protein